MHETYDDLIINYFIIGQGSEDEERLLVNLFRGYNSLIRPVQASNATAIKVNFGVAMILLINVVRRWFSYYCVQIYIKDEKNQVMQTNVWLTMTWHDFQMVWKPEQYGGIRTIRVPPDKVWLPDIVLFNK